jgi:4-amino-4-deoxy-L-arabinose transferase-like glycosyltransferase
MVSIEGPRERPLAAPDAMPSTLGPPAIAGVEPSPASAPAAVRAARWRRSLRWPLLLWAAVVVGSLAARPLVPVDETRYVSVAWEMWHTGDFLVPHLNGEPYSDKPPLLFWLIQAGWAVFGVSDWWPRVLPGLAGLAGLLLAAALARELWPERSGMPVRTATVLAGLLLWVVLQSVILFDLLLAATVLLAELGLVRAARGRRWSWLLVGLGLGLGGLTKGPVVLLSVLPPALLGPWWARPLAAGGEGGRLRTGRWYAGLSGALALGVAIAGGWALAAAWAAGPGYARSLLVGQTAGRVVHAFAHERAWWWYLPSLPVVLYPYALWGPLWRRARALPGLLPEPGVRFAVAAFVPALALFSAVSGKQPQYLAPLLPAAALLVARMLESPPAPRRLDLVAPVAVAGILAAALSAAPELAGHWGLPRWLSELSPGAGLVVLAAIAGTVWTIPRHPRQATRVLAALSAILVVGLYLGLSPMLRENYGLLPVADYLKLAETRGQPIAHVGAYHGELHFLGRLEEPFTVLAASEVPRWLDEHPNGRVVGHYAAKTTVPFDRAAFVHPCRGTWVVIWDREGLAATPWSLVELL